MWTSETGKLDVEVTPACGRVKAHGTAVLPTPRSLEGWPDFEKNGRGAGFQMCRLETISTLGQRKVRVLTVPLKGSGYSSRCKCTWCNLTDSHPINQIYVMRQLCQVGLKRKMESEGVNMLDLLLTAPDDGGQVPSTDHRLKYLVWMPLAPFYRRNLRLHNHFFAEYSGGA